MTCSKNYDYFVKSIIIALLLCGPALAGIAAADDDMPVFGSYDPANNTAHENLYGGPGTVYYQTVLDSSVFVNEFAYIRHGVLPPKAGIGEHSHEVMEEVYMVLNGPAEYTVDGETAILPKRSAVLCPLGSSHALYNPSDSLLLSYVAIAVSKEKGESDAIPTGGDITNRKRSTPPTFRWTVFDPTLCKWVGPAHDGAGKILNRRPWLDGNFETDWVRIGHCILPPGVSIGYHRHNATEEVYYIMDGNGRMTVNDVTFNVDAGDAIPCAKGDSHGLYNNTAENLDIFVVIVAGEPGVFDVTNWGDDLSDR